jgi:hypothetical protein
VGGSGGDETDLLYDKPNYSKGHTTIEGDGNG